MAEHLICNQAVASSILAVSSVARRIETEKKRQGVPVSGYGLPDFAL
jgi:hypothetical protein